MKTKFLMMTIAAGVLGLSGAASAEIVTATFTGTVNFVFDPDGGLPSASEGDTLVATYVFDLDQATQSAILPTGGEMSGPYGSFATASLTINGVAGVLPTFATGELTGETQVFDIGSVIDAVVSGGANHLDSNVEGTDFAWNLASPLGFSYSPTDSDQTLVQLGNDAGDLVEADISNVTIAVSSSSPVPEPSTWAMMLVGFAGFGIVAHRRKRAAAAPAV
jgi:PEP-CTERM motif